MLFIQHRRVIYLEKMGLSMSAQEEGRRKQHQNSKSHQKDTMEKREADWLKTMVQKENRSVLSQSIDKRKFQVVHAKEKNMLDRNNLKTSIDKSRNQSGKLQEQNENRSKLAANIATQPMNSSIQPSRAKQFRRERSSGTCCNLFGNKMAPLPVVPAKGNVAVVAAPIKAEESKSLQQPKAIQQSKPSKLETRNELGKSNSSYQKQPKASDLPRESLHIDDKDMDIPSEENQTKVLPMFRCLPKEHFNKLFSGCSTDGRSEQFSKSRRQLMKDLMDGKRETMDTPFQLPLSCIQNAQKRTLNG